MGFFSSLLKKKEPAPKVTVSFSEPARAEQKQVRKGTADPNGLYPADLIMLSLAPRYKTNETEYPRYLTYDYGIANPYKKLQELQAEGYIRKGTAKESLVSLKVSELKAITDGLGISCKKVRASLLDALANVDEADLDSYINERNWVVTESGLTVLNYNRYIEFFLTKHKYNISEAYIDVFAVSDAVHDNPKMRYRDCIWRLLNDAQNKAYIDVHKGSIGTSATYRYCNISRIMALYVEEDGQYRNAADYYFHYLYRWVNLHCGLSFLISDKLAKDNKAKDKAMQIYYEDSKLAEFQKKDILCFKEELGVSESELKDFMTESFHRVEESDIFNAKQLADFVMWELNEEYEKAEQLCKKVAKAALKKAHSRR